MIGLSTGEDVSIHERVTVGPSVADMLTGFYTATSNEIRWSFPVS